MSLLRKYISSSLEARIGFIIYRYRFLLVYTAIGVLSLFAEIMIFRWLLFVELAEVPSYLFAFSFSILFAYWFNVRLNFKVPIAKRNRAMFYFFFISLCSGLANLFLRIYLNKFGWSYEQSRLASSAVLFLLAYYMHRKFSFYDYKKVGVAIYANGVEDIRSINQRISHYPDFIHVDLIDDTYGEAQFDPKVYRLEVIKAYWPEKEVHVHLMSRTPSRWLDELLPFADVLTIHAEIEEDPAQVLKYINASGKKSGLCVMSDTSLQAAYRLAGLFKVLMLLSIRTPGKSGQIFEIGTLDRIAEINRWEQRNDFIICVDGGINEKNIGLLNVELVVSGSSVLNHPDPTRQIMRLQTASSYEAL
jgi:pentose-5-phosphate-3-epimerase/putative flippase GtrA